MNIWVFFTSTANQFFEKNFVVWQFGSHTKKFLLSSVVKSLMSLAVLSLWGAQSSSCSSTSLWSVVCLAPQCCKSSSFYLPIHFSLNGSVGLKKVLITLAKFVTNKIWHLPHYIKPSSYCVTSSLSRRSSVNKVSSNLQNDIG